ncbi:hypothetical protein J5N97_008175 [Dioscorea zingiberensis]|uniref:PRKR-interacting protein 1 n=1 Tax=Dioscorea zingiberensis TaxID=325984 RepID=A0A9D5DE72_9LILI|nr:hypothetical protein J5N97_008175 [Dioscorea zingiberensis]
MSSPSRESGAGGGGSVGDLMLVAAGASSPKTGALVEYGKGGGSGVLMREDEEDLEVKLRRIIENVPVRVSNTSGSSAGSGSGDFHQYRQMRRKEQDRLSRMDVDYQRRKELAEFNLRREERLKAAEERTAKKRSKRQKKKQRKKEKKTKTDNSGKEHLNDDDNSEDDDDDDDELKQ